MLIAVGGLIASGKSSIARSTALRLGAVHIEADAVRDEILHIEPGQAAHEAAWQDNLAPHLTERIYSEMLSQAREALVADAPFVIVDGCFSQRAQRLAARATATRCERPFLFIECCAPRSVLEQRLRDRSRAAGVPVHSWLALFDRLEARFDPVTELPEGEHFRIDADSELGELCDRVTAHVREISNREAGRAA